jgi:PAS domain S-box-containing protein
VTTIPTTSEHKQTPTVVYSLQSKIAFLFVILLTIVLVTAMTVRIYGLPFTSFKGEYAQRQKEILNNLNLVADLKKIRLSNWLKERDYDTQVIADSELFRNTVTALCLTSATLRQQGLSGQALWTALQENENYQSLKQHLVSVKKTYGIYETIQLVDSLTGKVIASTDATELGEYLSLADVFLSESLTQGKSWIDIQETTINKLKLSIVQPFFLHVENSPEKRFLIIASIDNYELANVLKDSDQHFEEATHIFLVSEDTQILHHSSMVETTMPMLDGSLKTQLTELAKRERADILTAKDDYGRVMLTAYRPLQATAMAKWGLVIKIERDEIFLPLYKESIYPFLVSGLISLILGVILSFVLARTLSRPIHVLCQTIRAIEDGNMDARTTVTTQDEVGLLAYLFNEMLDQLQSSQQKMEWLIEENAAELRTSNFSLLMTVDEMQDLNDDLAQEIAVRKQVEAQLRKERLQQQIIFDSVPAFIWQKDTENNVVWMNKPAAELSKIQDGSSEHYPWISLFPEFAEASYQEDLNIIQSGLSLLGIVEEVTVNGETLWLKTDKVPYIDETGSLVGIIVLSIDITDKLQAEQALLESEQRFRTIVDTAVDGIIMIDLLGDIQLFNPSFANMFDYSLIELQGKNIRQLMTVEYAEKYGDYLKVYREIDDNSIVGVGREIMGQRKDGSTFPIHLAIGELNLKEQRMFTAIVSDITELKQAQEALQNSKKALEIQNKAYSRFVPREFLSFLGKDNIAEVELGDQVQREMSVMFADIRSFTALSERLSPAENFKFINSYLSQMEPVVQSNHGFIDKYIGDSIMALFPDSANDAVCGAVAMLHTLDEFNQKRRQAGCLSIDIGIGIHTGLLMLGTIGGKNRMDGTVISDAVNLAARVESLTKMYGASLLITESTYNQLTHVDNYAIRIIDKVKVKGKSQPVIVFEVIDGSLPHIRNAKLATLELFTDAFIAYQAHHFELAEHYFRACLEKNPHDKAIHIYIKRCQHWRKYGDDQGWDGVMELESKDGLSHPDIVSPYFEV